MAITTRTFNDFLSSALNIVSTKANAALDTRVGSVIRAMYEASATQWLFLQSMILKVQTMQRGATSTGDDLVSFYADFGFSMLPATLNTGQATFSRYQANASAPIIPVAALVQASLGNIQYQVVADATNPAYVPAVNGYQLPANALSVTVSVQAVAAGTASNLLAGALNQLVTPLPGIDTVTNASPINNAKDAESEAASRVRFVAYITGGLIKATAAAIDSAIAGVQQGLNWLKLENQNFDQSAHLGFFTVVAQDGSGTLPAATSTAISQAIEATRGFTIGFNLQPPTTITANVAATAVLPAGLDAGTAAGAKTAAQNAVASYINGRSIGKSLEIERVSKAAIDAMIAYLAALGIDTGDVSLNGMTLNGAASDLACGATAIIRAGTVVVS